MKTIVSGLGMTALLLAALLALPLAAQAVNVTLQFNSSTIGDTLSTDHVVQVRGELNDGGSDLPDGNSITWDDASDLVMTNVGGDYWSVTFEMNADDTLKYKFWTGFDLTTGTNFWDGWEGPLNDPYGIDGDNRVIITGAENMVVDVEFGNSTETMQDQYWRPYPEGDDMVSFYFRVNMAGREENGSFDPDTMGPVDGYGGMPLAADDTWNLPFVNLTREGTSSFWSGYIQVDVGDLNPGDTQEYKFVYYDADDNQAWEDNISNRTFDVSDMIASGAHDTTLHWDWFNGQAPTGEDLINTTITWLMDPGALEELGFFDRTVGDQILISGPNGWTIPDQAIEVVYQPLLQQWIAQEDFLRLPGDELQYKFLVLYDSSRVDDTSPNYIPGLPGVELWEEPSSTGGSNRLYTILNEDEQTVPGDFTYDFSFYSGIPPEGVIPTNMTVNFAVDMAPATSADTNPTNPLFRPGVDTAYVYFESPLLMLTQGLPAYEHRVDLNDLDGDGVYTTSMDFTAPFTYQVGYRIGYTTDTDPVLNGGGVENGRRYYQFIWPESHTPGGETVWFDEFDLREMAWVNWPCPVETPPDFSMQLAVGDESGSGVPLAWELKPAFPNPFNPSTTISYTVAAKERVTIKVYSVLGQEVATLVNGVRNPGEYTLTWNGLNAGGQPVASGLYFVRLDSPAHQQVRKVTLLR